MVAPGTVLLDKYRVERVIGQGGMALVVAATHLALNEPVAIKLLLPEMAKNPTVVQRFLREAKAVVRLKGEHSVRVLDVGTLPDGSPFMVMELLVGVDLADVTKERTRLPPADAVDLLLQACEALAEAHAAGIVHRDIKPSNLFVTRRPDGTPLLKVLDFGISKVAFDTGVTDLTMDSIVGTPSYMSPEQLRGSDVDARADVWSLGIVLYRLLAGARPFKADSLAALAIQAATEPTPPLPMPYPPGLDFIVYRCLEKDPLRRYQSVAELAFALAPFAGDQRTAAIVVERTRSILGWVPPVPSAAAIPVTPMQLPAYLVPGPASVGPSEPTTLGSSAGAMQRPLVATMPPRTGRGLTWAIGGGVVVGALIAIVMSLSSGGGGTSGGPVTPTAAPETPPRTEPVAPHEPEPAVEPAAVVTPPVGDTPATPPLDVDQTGDTTSTTTTAATATRPDERKRHRTRVRVTRPEPKTTKPDGAAGKTDATKPPANPLDTRM